MATAASRCMAPSRSRLFPLPSCMRLRPILKKKSTATYGTSDSIGTSVSYDFSVDSSQTNEPVWVDGAAFKAFLSVVADALGVAGAAAAASAAADGSAAGAAAAKTTAGQLTSASKDITSIGGVLPSLTDTNQH